MIRAILFFLILITILNPVNLACSFLCLRFVLISKDLSVEGYDIQAVIDHGAQFDQKSPTPEESEGKTQLVSFQEGFHLTVKESIAAACSDTRVPSFSRSSFSSSSSRSNVHHGKYTMEVFGLQTIEETVRTSLPYVQYAMAPCDRQDIRPWCEKLSELAERSGEACDSMAWPSTVATAKCAVGSLWQQSAQNPEKEVQAEECQGQQNPSRRTTSSTRSDDADPTNDWHANGIPRSIATCSASHELGRATYAYDAIAISAQWQPTSITSAASWGTMAYSNARNSAVHAICTVNELCDGNRIHHASDAEGALYAGVDGASFPRAHGDAETRCGRASAAHSESSEGVCTQGWSQGWCTSHKESSCSCNPSWTYAQGIRRCDSCTCAIAQQLEKVLVGCSQVMAGICSAICSSREKTGRSDRYNQGSFPGCESVVLPKPTKQLGRFKRSRTKSLGIWRRQRRGQHRKSPTRWRTWTSPLLRFKSKLWQFQKKKSIWQRGPEGNIPWKKTPACRNLQKKIPQSLASLLVRLVASDIIVLQPEAI